MAGMNDDFFRMLMQNMGPGLYRNPVPIPGPLLRDVRGKLTGQRQPTGVLESMMMGQSPWWTNPQATRAPMGGGGHMFWNQLGQMHPERYQAAPDDFAMLLRFLPMIFGGG